ncbi:LacI family DNA-binding transcriptional regulator [Propionibacteriaceae bacterium Y1923]|uniref:LacI family DNA-binding transcriptional regulator n=1 Tax=Aestuariimicrobium sp. Y1814 TaxID=3418742 RepID=UPI003C1BF5F0
MGERAGVGAPTMDDVAEAAGVSRTSVSRVFLGQKKVSEETVWRVREVAAQLGYVPNRIASGLASGRTRTVGLVLPGGALDALLLTHLQAEARLVGLDLIAMVSPPGRDESSHLGVLPTIIGMQVSGLVVVDGAIPDQQLEQYVGRLPIVRTGLAEPGAATHAIWCDALQAGRAIAEHVVDRGHLNAVVLTSEASHAQFLRGQGMLEALTLRGLSPHPVKWVDRRRQVDEALDLVKAGAATVVMCPSDDVALEVLRRARARHLSVPEQLSVTGVEGLTPGLDVIGLATVRLDLPELARRTIATLTRVLAGDDEPPARQLVPGTLVPGFSVADLTTG